MMILHSFYVFWRLPYSVYMGCADEMLLPRDAEKLERLTSAVFSERDREM